MKLLAIVITYFPDVEELRRNILQYIDQVDKLIIWENTPKEIASEYKIDLPLYQEKIIIDGTGKNEFIAYPLNESIKWAKNEGFTHILTMDQDSCFQESAFKKYIQTIAANEAPDIGIWGANPNNMYNAVTPILEVPQCITSGTIYPLSVFDKIGLFREDFAIYVVDIEFGIRARKYGYKTVVVPAATLYHTFGRPTKTFFGYISSNYSPFITYLIIRNTIVTWIEYPDHFKVRKGFIQYTILYRILAIILHEKQKWKKLRAIAWGICDGIRKKMDTRTF